MSKTRGGRSGRHPARHVAFPAMQVRRTIEATSYVALSFALGTISFWLVMPTLVVGFPLLIVALAGTPLIALAFIFCHLLARVERRRVGAMMGVEFPRRQIPRDGSIG